MIGLHLSISYANPYQITGMLYTSFSSIAARLRIETRELANDHRRNKWKKRWGKKREQQLGTTSDGFTSTGIVLTNETLCFRYTQKQTSLVKQYKNTIRAKTKTDFNDPISVSLSLSLCQCLFMKNKKRLIWFLGTIYTIGLLNSPQRGQGLFESTSCCFFISCPSPCRHLTGRKRFDRPSLSCIAAVQLFATPQLAG